MSSLGEMLKKNNGNFMVSIHGVPVNVLLIISVVYLIFRFKSEAETSLSYAFIFLTLHRRDTRASAA